MASPGQGQAVRIVHINGKQFELDTAALEAILKGPECRDRPICIVSIAGATRKGKSFMLNLFLRYLQSKGSPDWLNDDKRPLLGFSWKAGSVRDTTGILLWSTPFVVKGPEGREVAVLLMDTQGSFDGLHTLADTAAIFAVSTLTSSVQVYNLFNNIQEDDLQNLEMFTEYGRLALEQSREQPFQKLLFLVRDWQFPEEYEYGLRGGKQFLDSKLAVTDERTGELQRVRVNLKAVFRDLQCFPMPHPGMKVARTKNFDGRLEDVDPDFVRQLKVLVPHLLHGGNIITKKINGQQVTGSELFVYFKAYVSAFTSGDLIKPESIMAATARANNQTALTKARDHYKRKMDEAFGVTRPSMAEAEAASKHAQFSAEAIAMFSSQKKMGGASMSQSYLEKLKSFLNSDAKQYRDANFFKRQTEEHTRKSEELKKQMNSLQGQCQELERARQREQEENSVANRELREELERQYELNAAQHEIDSQSQREMESQLRGRFETMMAQNARLQAQLKAAYQEREESCSIL
ncbi:Atlastin-1 [Halotydeus destructor]|nr:Atlastin-1 [Halotydeus destructor]